MERILCLILGGGKGSSLYPLTRERSKSAVPFGGKYRLVDIPISDCINSGLKSILVTCQYHSASLHSHLTETYSFDGFTRGFTKLLAAETSYGPQPALEGTADSIRRALAHMESLDPTHVLILPGDQLFRMNFQELIQAHKTTGADVTLVAKPLPQRDIDMAGAVLKINPHDWVVQCRVKPQVQDNLESFSLDSRYLPKSHGDTPHFLAHMGIYLFNYQTLKDSLESGHRTDLRKEILPDLIQRKRVGTYFFWGVWENLGSLHSFYQANLGLTTVNPAFNFYDEVMPIYSNKQVLPLSKINFSNISQSLISEGCIITNATLANSIIGLRSIIDSGSVLDGVVFMGADIFESQDQKARNRREGVPHIGVGKGTTLKKTIVDKNARIGEGCRIGADPFHRPEGDYGHYSVRDGIIIISKGAIIPSGTVI